MSTVTFCKMMVCVLTISLWLTMTFAPTWVITLIGALDMFFAIPAILEGGRR